MPATIRSAGPDDVAAVLGLWRRAAHGTSISDDETSVAALVAHPMSRCLLAEVDGAVVGSLIVGWDGWRLHLYRLAVDPDHRREGIARMLLQEAELIAVEIGARRVDAMVDDGNEDGSAFWSAAGFRPNHRYTRFERTTT